MATRGSNNSSSAAKLEGPRSLDPAEHTATIDLLNSVLRPNGPPTILQEYPLVLGKENLWNMRVIVRGGKVLCHAAVYYSRVRAGDLTFKVGGIGSVATDASCRGRGLASRVLQDCIRVTEQAGCHFSLLWTQISDFYRKLGYEAAGSEYLFQVSSADFSEISRTCSMVPFNPAHLSKIIEIHDREALRTERTLKEYEAYFGLPKATTLVAVRGDTVTAYAVMGKGEDFGSCIHEWGGVAEDVLCLAREFARQSRDDKILILVPAQKKEFTQRLLEMKIPANFEYLAMMKVVNAELVGETLRDPFKSLTGKDLKMARSGPGVRMDVGDEMISLVRETNLVRLLFGPEQPSKLLRKVSSETLSALEQFFPIPLFIWGLDSV